MRDWKRHGKQGFAGWHGPTKKLKFYEVKSPQEIELMETHENAVGHLWFWQVNLQTWITEKSFQTKPRYEGKPERFEVVHGIFIIEKDGSSTIFVGNPLTKEFVGLTMPGQVITFAIPQILLCSFDNPR